MAPRLVLATLVLTVVGVCAPATARPSADVARPMEVTAPAAFSPNRDGVRDRLEVRYRLVSAGVVTVTVVSGRGEPVLRRVLGRRVAGVHTWTWDGRGGDGRRLRQDHYTVRVRTARQRGEARVELDTRFRAAVWASERFGLARDAALPVYPRSTVVRDQVLLEASAEQRARSAVLLVKDVDGRTVLRRDLLAHPTGEWVDGSWKPDPAVWEARARDGRPLAPGRYTAVVKGRDALGNAGPGKPLALRVSAARLGWVEETRVVPAADGRPAGVYCQLFSGANGCADVMPCGPLVPSELFPGGLSHRAAPCTDYRSAFGPPEARSLNFFAVPDAVRGIQAMRVAFSGAPTRSGESDTGTLDAAGSTVTSSTGGRSEWGPSPLGKGREWDPAYALPRQRPLAMWWFSTFGDDSFDVASYTVDLRYLAVEDGPGPSGSTRRHG